MLSARRRTAGSTIPRWWVAVLSPDDRTKQCCRRCFRSGPVTGIVAGGQFASTMRLSSGTSWRAAMTGVSRWLQGTSYLQKWLVLGVLIGTMAGVGAIVFYEALLACTHFFLGVWPATTCPRRPVRGATGRQLRSPGPGPCRWSSGWARCSVPARVPIRPRGRGPRNRCGHLCGPPQPAGASASGR